jgi:hypothetical protein
LSFFSGKFYFSKESWIFHKWNKSQSYRNFRVNLNKVFDCGSSQGMVVFIIDTAETEKNSKLKYNFCYSFQLLNTLGLTRKYWSLPIWLTGVITFVLGKLFGLSMIPLTKLCSNKALTNRQKHLWWISQDFCSEQIQNKWWVHQQQNMFPSIWKFVKLDLCYVGEAIVNGIHLSRKWYSEKLFMPTKYCVPLECLGH